MKNVFFDKKFIPFLIIVFSAISVFADDPPMFNYIGTEACGKCHKSEKQGKQLIIWKESIHAGAYKTLLSEDAIKIAKEMGFDKLPHELVECLVCHASGYDVDNERLEVGFKIEDGVQCETCHGAGSEYKKLSIMKDIEKAKENGLIVHTEKEAFCTGCHNSESPTFKSFNYEEMWSKIAHKKP